MTRRTDLLDELAARQPPRVSTLVSLTACTALAAAFVVGVATQPDQTRQTVPCGRIEGLVLDGSGVTTTQRPYANRPADPIPYRAIGDPTTTTTTTGCGR